MIRAVLVVAGFIAVTIALVVAQSRLHGPVPVFAAAQDPAAHIAPDDEVSRAITGFDTLGQGLPALAASPAGTATPAPDGLATLIVAALRQGQSEDDIDALVNDAARKGAVEVPGALLTADGLVDTATLLATLTAPPRGKEAGGGRVYTARPGDSLASISYRFYGRTDRHEDIFVANRDILSAPESITAGLVLRIPEF